MDITQATVQELLSFYTATLQELKNRAIISTSNSPVGEYGEQLICKVFGWTRERNSQAGYDATDSNGLRYEIKSRRLIKGKASRQLSAIRGIEEGHFHYLVGVLFQEDCSLFKAIIIPHQTIREHAKHAKHTNSWAFHLKDDVWAMPGNTDITEQVKNGLAKLDPYTLAQL